MTEKDNVEKMTDEEMIETFEFTDEDGQNHCFVVESKFKVGNDDYAALLEVDPDIFEEDAEDHGCDYEDDHGQGHEHTHSATCGCGNDHEEEEEPNIILAKIVTDANGEVDIQVPTDTEFEKAVKVYEALES